MHKPIQILLLATLFPFSACKQQPAPTTTVEPQTTTADNGSNTAYKAEVPTPAPDMPPDAMAEGHATRPDNHPEEHAEARTEMTDEETKSYHKACHFILSRMASCAKDPGFLKYQSRWVAKGAPRVTAKEFEKKILSWNQESSRTHSCKEWNQLPNTRAHFASASHLASLREDAKLSCELFGQELDDDGWFPAALIGS